MKASRIEPRSVTVIYSFSVGKGLVQMPFTVRCVHAVYDDRCITRPAIGLHVWCKSLVMVETVLMRKDLVAWSPCCFDDQCNDRSSRFSHAVWPACDVWWDKCL